MSTVLSTMFGWLLSGDGLLELPDSFLLSLTFSLLLDLSFLCRSLSLRSDLLRSCECVQTEYWILLSSFLASLLEFKLKKYLLPKYSHETWILYEILFFFCCRIFFGSLYKLQMIYWYINDLYSKWILENWIKFTK